MSNGRRESSEAWLPPNHSAARPVVTNVASRIGCHSIGTPIRRLNEGSAFSSVLLG